MACFDETSQLSFYIFIGWLSAVLGWIIGHVTVAISHRYRLRHRNSLPDTDSSTRSDPASLEKGIGSVPRINKISTTTTQFGHAKSDMDRNIGHTTTYV
ncbi:hypothetical protein N7471_000375 [Penicillium samsonianum]|uniref:uncharacterized protein n=1 Tax=Penicillium samsonianum TaxID=1882272 RepID=UPI002548BF54|nr:uncharacterized protein N7471_000375 [Penicillium samsonianum]KAJ6149176.1 hypothetical protein N7471_000375 [Penicillium samsonianum]